MPKTFLLFLPNFTALFVVHAQRDRIVGGYEPLPHSLPYIVHLDRITNGDGYFCCGSLINTQWVLSAAHCRFDPVINPFEVVLGDHDRTVYEGSEQYIQVTLAINHPWYNPLITDNDIMMLKLQSPAKLDQYVQLAVLPDANNPVGEGVGCTACGWGYTDYVGTTLPDSLQCAEAFTLTNEQCNTMYHGEVKSSMLCAASNGKDACKGDSGGPFTCNGLLHGITSTGYGCGYPNFPGIYVRVTEFIDWINTVTTYN